MIYPYFIGPSYRSQSPVQDTERCVNWYPERMEVPGAKSQFAMYPTPGVTLVCSVAQAPIRGVFSQNGRCFFVAGYELYELSSAWVATARGVVDSDANPVTFCTNGDAGHQLFITSGNKGYILDLNTNVLTQVLTGATQGAFLDGCFLAIDPATSTFKASALLDGTTWPSNRQTQRSSGSDRWAALAVIHREIWLIGQQTSEVWWNDGSAPMPFVPIPGAFLPVGTAAPFSLAPCGSSLAWISQSDQGAGTVVRAEQYQAQRISTHAIDFKLQGYSTISDAVAWSYQDQGHEFYGITCPTAQATWVLDADAGWWHERLYWDATTAAYQAWRPMFHTQAFGAHLVGDRLTGDLYTMSITDYSDVGGAAIRRVRRAPHLNSEAKRLFPQRFQLDLETGIGRVTGQGSNPQIMLRASIDGGRTFGTERWVSAGALGQYKTRAIWNRFSAGRDLVFEIVVSDPVPWRLTNAYIDLVEGVN